MNNINLNSKRGTHVGMIVSFLIFVTFLAFLYSVLEPATRVKQDKLDLQEYLKIELLKEFTTEMSVLTISIADGESSGCIDFSPFDDTLRFFGVVAKDDSGEIYEYKDGTHTKVDWDRGNLKLYYSTEFSNGSFSQFEGKTCRSGDDYEIKLFRTEEDFFNSSIIRVAEYINENPDNYKEIKTKLKIPFGDEFGFAFKDENKKLIIGTSEKNVSADVYVEEIPIQYIDSEANINQGFLDIRVW